MELLQIKLQQARRRHAREAFFALRIIPALAVWAGLPAVIDMVAGALIPPGVTLTLFFGGSALLVVWLGRRSADHRLIYSARWFSGHPYCLLHAPYGAALSGS